MERKLIVDTDYEQANFEGEYPIFPSVQQAMDYIDAGESITVKNCVVIDCIGAGRSDTEPIILDNSSFYIKSDSRTIRKPGKG